ncbi:NAD(P)/FAD-dependent oxidoreductase [Oceanobacillus halophilus]|uniref:Ferredoxin--NADP reductase n=1 Tax=Oceanobacillus halophilus TaxID=930130 RepID=A0A495A0P2_9BACI|nr:NAD(P)/FAD-dependent oxidoreductase [Oceanobacillus halophilus]RKQ32706.1 NAD(P)/FAD-dependent oxidoreductase [Oceanobacillus halophilus]
MSNHTELFDVTIIGGGPVGLFTAFYSGMREMKTKIIEYLPFLGGKVSYFYPEKIIRDIGGLTKISGRDLTDNLIEQAMTFDPTIVLKEQVLYVEKLADGTFMLTSSNGNKHHTKSIILATGFGTLKSVKLELPNSGKFEEKSLHYTIKKLSDYKGKHVLISGGGNSAIDWANELEPIAEKVTLIYRKPQFTGIESNVTKMMNSTVQVLNPYELTELKEENGKLSSAVIKHVNTQAFQEIKIDNIIVNHGFHIDLGPITNWGMIMKDGTIKVDESMSTSIPGIFAIGDISNYPNKLGLIAGGFNEGPIAVNQAKQYISPKEHLGHIYSTNYEPLIRNDK